MKRSLHCLLTICLGAGAFAAGPADQKSGTLVDSGKFGIKVNGTRVATETFRIEQREASSIITSELRLDDPKNPAAQSSELELESNGALKKYTWREISPGKGQIVVQPNDQQFMALRTYENPGAEPKESTHALTPFTSILDDNFFSQMEVMVWKYMAAGCKPGPNGQPECIWSKQKMPVLNPHQQESLLVNIEYTGSQEIGMKGKKLSYKTFKLEGESTTWVLWFNQENKLMRVFIDAEKTEIIRD